MQKPVTVIKLGIAVRQGAVRADDIVFFKSELNYEVNKAFDPENI